MPAQPASAVEPLAQHGQAGRLAEQRELTDAERALLAQAAGLLARLGDSAPV